MKRSLGLAGLMFAAATAHAAVQGKEVSYSANGTTLKGYVAYDDAVFAKARFDADYSLISKESSEDANNIGAIGYCFGGSVALNKARIVSFSGEADPFIPAAQVAAFRQEMDKGGMTYKVVTYPGAKHSITNPDADEFGQEFKLPLAYNAAADKASWDEGRAFLADAFKAK